jgi:cell division septum initiation protein DivIVA
MAAQEPQAAGASLASSTSQRVQAILEAAEASAAEIRREAEREAEEIRRAARSDAAQTTASTQAALRRLEELHAELGTLVGSLRGQPARGAEPPAADAARSGEVGPSGMEVAVSSAEEVAPSGKVALGSAEAPEPDEDGAGIRLIALNMALDGAPREQTAAYLAENFALTDSARLLDEVYRSIDA